jgi:hypothetical protein
MRHNRSWLAPAGVLLGLATGLAMLACEDDHGPTGPSAARAKHPAQGPLNPALVAQGRTIFRFETYGDETFWTDTLRLHEVIEDGVSPLTALSVGLKVDADALPPGTLGRADLNDLATTVALLKLNAVVGLKGTVETVNGENRLTRVGITCAFCHSTVNNSVQAGIGQRLDGWPNRDLDVGAIVALSPALTPAQKAVYTSWGPGMYDPRFNLDGKNIPVVIPPAFGLRHVEREIYTGDDTISYWNAYVAITQMHGHGHFADPRIGVDVNNPPDLVSSKLKPLRVYQFSLETPEALAGSFDASAARRGHAVFNGAAGCARCHLGSTYTDVTAGRLHPAVEVGQDPAYARRSATGLYRTTPLRGLWHPPQLKGPYFHDGNAGTLAEVVEHYVQLFGLSLSAQQKADLVEYLQTL